MCSGAYGANSARPLAGCMVSVSFIVTSNLKVCSQLLLALTSTNSRLDYKDILLTTQIFSSLSPTSPRPTLDALPLSPKPLIKLADFGLSRFIKVDEATGQGELLWTRCGSEAYAAPELVMGTGSARTQARPRAASLQGEQEETVRGFYDARETDAWACGVVLYGLVVRRLPFGEGVDDGVAPNGDGRVMIGGDGAPGHGHGGVDIVARRRWLLRIARGEYEWPTDSDDEPRCDGDDAKELVGPELARSQGLKRIVGRLLVRDPRKRARIMELWEEDWMWGAGGGLTVGLTEDEWRLRERHDDGCNGLELKICGERSDDGSEEVEIDEERFLDEGMVDEDEMEAFEEVVDGEEGWLLDQEGIGSVARQEMV